MPRSDFVDSDSFFANETEAKLEQTGSADNSPFADPLVRPLFGGSEATSGFSGTFNEEGAEVYGTVLVAGHRSLGFRASLKWLAEA